MKCVKNVLTKVLEFAEPFIEYEKKRQNYLEIINNNNLSLSEKLDQLPQPDPKIMQGMILIEILLQKKLGTTEYGGRLWAKLGKAYESQIDELGKSSPERWLFMICGFCNMSSPKNYLANVLKHEIYGTQDIDRLFFDGSMFFDVEIEDLEKIYNFIQALQKIES